MLTQREVVINGKKFNLRFDPDKMKREALSYSGLSEEAIEELGYNLDPNASEPKRPTPKEMDSTSIQMIEDIDLLLESDTARQGLVRGMYKKKDGYCKKGAINHWTVYESTAYSVEECYGDDMLTIKAKAADGINIDVDLVHDIFKW